jgi:hypothetical protein
MLVMTRPQGATRVATCGGPGDSAHWVLLLLHAAGARARARDAVVTATRTPKEKRKDMA